MHYNLIIDAMLPKELHHSREESSIAMVPAEKCFSCLFLMPAEEEIHMIFQSHLDPYVFSI